MVSTRNLKFENIVNISYNLLVFNHQNMFFTIKKQSAHTTIRLDTFPYGNIPMSVLNIPVVSEKSIRRKSKF